MPIQNIDNYLMPNRSQEASIFKSHGESKIPLEQQVLTNEVNNKSERNLNRTNETKRTDSKEQGFDAKEKGTNEYYRSKTRKKKKDDSLSKTTKMVIGTEGRTIDIKL